jgi:hypothetical protein
MGPEVGMDILEKRKILLLPLGTVPECPAHSLVSILTMLSKLILIAIFFCFVSESRRLCHGSSYQSLAHHCGGQEFMWDLW